MQNEFNEKVPAVPQMYYVLETRKKNGREWEDAPVNLYEEIFHKNRHLLDFNKGNWAHPNITRDAFRFLFDKDALARQIKSIEEDENSLFRKHNKIENYAVYTIPVAHLRMLSLDDRMDEIISRMAAANENVGDIIRDGFAERFIGRTFDISTSTCFALHVGNELSLRELSTILGSGVAEAVAGPRWEEIADQRYMKCKEADAKLLMKTIRDSIPDEKLPECLRWLEKQRYGYYEPLVMNNWALFAEKYDGFSVGGNFYLVTDSYKMARQECGPLPEIVSKWKKSGEIDVLTRIESMTDFGSRFANTFMRMRAEQDEVTEKSRQAALWITPGGWHEDFKALSQKRLFPALGR